MKKMRLSMTSLLTIALVISMIVIAALFVNIESIEVNAFIVQLFSVFLTGLLTGGLSCMALQGGLLTSAIASSGKDVTNGIMVLIFFLVSKLIAYSILGFILGFLGSTFQISIQLMIVLQVIVIVFMLGSAFNLLQLHPIFRIFSLQPPKIVFRYMKRFSRRTSYYAPIVLGLMTVLIPCGVTQAMMLLALGSANPITGAALLFSFVLGTIPVFFLLGYMTTRLSEAFSRYFTTIAAYTLIGLVMYNSVGLYNLVRNGFLPVTSEQESTSDDKQVSAEYTIEMDDSGYTPEEITVEKESRIRLIIKNKDGKGCIQVFTIPQFAIRKVIPPGSEETIELSIPSKQMDIAFMCSMGMYSGKIKVR